MQDYIYSVIAFVAMAIVLQIVWPLWPYYALGCLIGCCFFHVFVVEDERAELRRAVIEREQTAKYAAELEKAQDPRHSAPRPTSSATWATAGTWTTCTAHGRTRTGAACAEG